jgi:uncharacterized protein DUF6515
MTVRSRMRGALCAGSMLALSWAVLPPAHPEQITSGATTSHDSALHEPEYHEHAFREADYRDPRFFDSRHDHDHYYPQIGSVFGELPRQYQVIPDPEGDLYFADGVWYRAESPGRYVVVAPEIGISVPALPAHYTTVMMDGVPYYYANNTYYLESPSGYLVADPADR